MIFMGNPCGYGNCVNTERYSYNSGLCYENGEPVFGDDLDWLFWELEQADDRKLRNIHMKKSPDLRFGQHAEKK